MNKELIEAHIKKILKSDTSYPIFVTNDNKIVDGAHRALHSLIDNKPIMAKILSQRQLDKARLSKNSTYHGQMYVDDNNREYAVKKLIKLYGDKSKYDKLLDPKKLMENNMDAWGERIVDLVMEQTKDKSKKRQMNKFATIFSLSFLLKQAKLKALPHQKRVSEIISKKKQKGLLLYHALGSGKTFSAINAAKEMGAKLVAIVPASLRNNFEKEIKKANFKNQYKVISYNKALKLKDDLDFLKFCADAVVVYDEAHAMGRGESKRSQLPSIIPAKKVIMLTGTPIRNRPEEIIPLIKGLDVSNFPTNPKSFKERYIEVKKIHPSLWGRLWHGAKPGIAEIAKNIKDFKLKTKKVIDHYCDKAKGLFPDAEERIVKIEMSKPQLATYSYMLGKYPKLAYKVTHGIPPNNTERGKMQYFLAGPRMIANTPTPYSQKATHKDAAKIQALADDLDSYNKEDKNFKALVYSNYLKAGVDEIAKELNERNISFEYFTGRENDQKKKLAVDKYNRGETKVLLISGAGAEGLDLKGTKVVSILEPHWNEEKINQVKGRAIRFKSHHHLPKSERKVKINRYISTVPKTFLQRLMGWKADFSVDEYLYDLAKKKQKLNKQFLRAMENSNE